MESKKEIIFVNEMYNLKVIYNDLLSDERVTVLDGPYKELRNPILCYIRNAHCNPEKNKYFEIPFKGIWSNSLRKIQWNNSKEYIIIFLNSSIYPISVNYLLHLQQRYNIKYILHMNDHWDSFFSKKAQYYSSKIKFEFIFTVDKGDAEKYGFLFSDFHYSMLLDKKSWSVDYDLYFNGQDKGRLATLHTIYTQMQEEKVTAKYRIARVRDEDCCQKGIIYNKSISYQESLSEMKRCNTILEILTPGMTGATLRYNEAICYNKKLLTNNKNVINLPFYNSNYIHVFEKPEDIDWEWVKERIPVDYHYDGRFSPTHLIDKIIELEEEKESQQNVKKETS